MFLLRRPSPESLDEFVERAKRLGLSYSPIGLARDAEPTGFRVDEVRVVLGHGEKVFERARGSIERWCPFDLGWAGIHPTDAPVMPGTTVAVMARHLGFWSIHACRIVYRLKTGDPVPGATTPGSAPLVSGFAYGTLTEHAETGEEIFAVSMDLTTGTVVYSIRAVSRERAVLAKLGAPVARAFQARFRRDSLAAMQRHIDTP